MMMMMMAVAPGVGMTRFTSEYHDAEGPGELLLLLLLLLSLCPQVFTDLLHRAMMVLTMMMMGCFPLLPLLLLLLLLLQGQRRS